MSMKEKQAYEKYMQMDPNQKCIYPDLENQIIGSKIADKTNDNTKLNNFASSGQLESYLSSVSRD